MSGFFPLVCLCGEASGYPHRTWCPRPLFIASEEREAQWWAEARGKAITIGRGVLALAGKPDVADHVALAAGYRA